MLDLSPETEALARTVAEARRLSVDAAVRGALEAQSQRSEASASANLQGNRSDEALLRFRAEVAASAPAKDMSPEAVAARIAAMDRIVEEIDALPILDPRPIQDIIDDINEI